MDNQVLLTWVSLFLILIFVFFTRYMCIKLDRKYPQIKYRMAAWCNGMDYEEYMRTFHSDLIDNQL